MEAIRYRHVKRGTTYRILHDATMQMSNPGYDNARVVVYQGTDGRVWVRPYDEFMDGRFQPVPPGPLDYVPITGPGVDALENRKESDNNPSGD